MPSNRRRKPRPEQADAADQPAVDPGGSPAAPRRSLIDTIPAWLSALAAVGGLLIALLGIGVVTGVTQTKPPDPGVRLLSVTVDEDRVSAVGEYISLRAGRDEVMLMARPATDTPGEWLYVEAALQPTLRNASAGLEDGEWAAEMPVDLGGQQWQVQPLLVRGGVAGLQEGALAKLRTLGQDADVVIAAGEIRAIGGAPSP